MMRFVALALLVVFLQGGDGWTGAAAAPSKPRLPITAANGIVSIADQPVLRLRTALAGVPADQRAEIIATRLQELADRGADPSTLRASKAAPNVDIRFADVLLFTITRAEASAQNSTPESLAELWVSRLRKLFRMPSLTVSASRLVVPLGETRQITFGGLLKSPQSVSGGEGVATVTLDPGKQRATVSGVTNGDARLLFSRNDITLPVEIQVRPYAGRIPAAAAGFVTGYVTPKTLISRIALAAAQQSLRLEPGAVVKMGDPRVPLGLRAGHTMRLSVPIHIEAPRSIPVEGQLPVTVRNMRLPRAVVPLLLYSNEPEQVAGYGSLFLGQLMSAQPVRLLYHHQNKMGRRFMLGVDVVNPGEQSVRLHVIEGQAPNCTDPIVAGMYAARAFLNNDRAGIGYIVELPARSRVPLFQHPLRPGEVASGICGLRCLDDGARCLVQVKADDVNEPFVRPADETMRLSSTTFGTAVKNVNAAYAVGGRWSFIRIGSPVQKGDSRLSAEGFGDYGITYEISLSLSNPSSRTRRVCLVFEAASGPARGLFLLDGYPVETQTLNAHDELVLALYNLPPGGRRDLRVTTMPLAGSAYPARLVVRDLPDGLRARPGSLLPRNQ